MIGILTEPDQHTRKGPAILLFNVGLNHHVGPHRMNVELARSLSERGYVSLRFDLSGLGDSEPRKDNRSDEERAELDLGDAMDLVGERTGIREFVVVGLCSGVDPAHAVAVTDRRVRGAVFIDGYAYTTRGYYAREMVDRAMRVFAGANYRRWYRRVILPVLDPSARPKDGSNPIFDRTFPPREQFKRDLDTMLRRGVSIFFLYTRQAYFFNHRNQFVKMIGVRTLPVGVEVERQVGADHVFTSTFERARGVRRIADWVEAHFGSVQVSDEQTMPRGVDREADPTPRRA
jgi:pimeloyl-ACP methyl ester carboxylesterase